MHFFKMAFSDDYDEFLRRYDITGDRDDSCPVCDTSSGIPRPPIALRVYGIPLPDIIIFSAHLVVKDEVKEAIEDAGFVGVRFLPVEVEVSAGRAKGKEWELRKTSNKESRLYYVSTEKIRTEKPLQKVPSWHIEVTGRARLHPENKCVPVQSCGACGYVIYSTWENGMRVDESTWDRSDFFRLEEHSGFVIVSEPAKLLFEARKFTGVRYIALSEVIDEYAAFRPPRGE